MSLQRVRSRPMRSYRDFAMVQVGVSRAQRDTWMFRARHESKTFAPSECVRIARERNHAVIHWLREAREHIEAQLTAARSAA